MSLSTTNNFSLFDKLYGRKSNNTPLTGHKDEFSVETETVSSSSTINLIFIRRVFLFVAVCGALIFLFVFINRDYSSGFLNADFASRESINEVRTENELEKFDKVESSDNTLNFGVDVDEVDDSARNTKMGLLADEQLDILQDSQSIDTNNTPEIWSEYDSNDFSFNYPTHFTLLSDPRELDDENTNTVYFLLDEKAAGEYQKCLEIGKKQNEEYKANPETKIDWADWEGACDIERVALTVSVKKVSDVESAYLKKPGHLVYEENGISKNSFGLRSPEIYVDTQGRNWLWEKPEWGPFGQIGSRILLEVQGNSYLITSSAHTRTFIPYLNLDTQQGELSDETTQTLLLYHEQFLSDLINSFFLH